MVLEDNTDAKKHHVVDEQDGLGSPSLVYENGTVQEDKTYAYDDSRKLGVTGAVFLILNKMIGTGSECFPYTENDCSSHLVVFSTPSGIFAATGSVGVCLFLWVIGKRLSQGSSSNC
jgi:hypothetical protein